MKKEIQKNNNEIAKFNDHMLGDLTVDGQIHADGNITTDGKIRSTNEAGIGVLNPEDNDTSAYLGFSNNTARIRLRGDGLGADGPFQIQGRGDSVRLSVEDAGTVINGTLDVSNKVTAPEFVGDLTGNATTATTLGAPRTINNVPFDGSESITITAAPNTHTWNQITDRPSTFPPATHSHNWDSITEKPTTFAPTTHNHTWGQITDRPSTFPPATHAHNWDSITGRPATFAPATHNHNADHINAGTLNIARIPTGTTSTTVSLGNHTHPLQTTITGNAATATRLQTARQINGVNFDGSANITITANPTTTRLAANANLNDIVTPGNYNNPLSAEAATIGNTPTNEAFSLQVIRHGGNDANAVTQIFTNFQNENSNFRRFMRNRNGIAWGAWFELPFSAGTARTFDMNVTRASQLTTARTINGTSFNGTANITTANWGTGRNITIGNHTVTGFNGSGNLAMTLAQIGAAPTSHNHTWNQITDRPAIPTASTTNPVAPGTVAVGTGTTFARADHRHPLPTLAQIGAAPTSHNHTWNQITDRPTTLPPSAHTHNASDITVGTLPIARGGTGATTAAAARNALGLGNTAAALPIANGGTGATTAAAARNALGLGNTTAALPIANGGTGATTAAAARTNLGALSTAGGTITGTLTTARINAGNLSLNHTTGSNTIENLSREIYVIGSSEGGTSNAAIILRDRSAPSGNRQFNVGRNASNQPRVWSPLIYNRTTSSAANVRVSSEHTLLRVTSAAKYKLNITKVDTKPLAEKILALDVTKWFDKSGVETYADMLTKKSKGEACDFEDIPPLKEHYGLIAEDVVAAGLDMYVDRDHNGEIEGIEYDRLWTLLIPLVRDQRDKIEKLDNKLTQQDEEINLLKKSIAEMMAH